MSEEQNTSNIASFVDSRILAGLSVDRRASVAREVMDVADAVAQTPLPPDAEPSSYLRTMASYAAKAS
ncbi:hypothetical protein CYK37_24805 [Mesorhizobium loti]|nr:hypothetical protein [Mesorhizobium loti]PLP56658.1 hypothetical protein CYK37_24805 [Mesorhizobium loti]